MVDDELYWVGISPSDISGIEHLFEGIITIIGSKNISGTKCYSLEEELDRRINYNNPENFHLCNQYYIDTINAILRKTPSARFLWQDQQSFSESLDLTKGTIANNRIQLLKQLSNKIVIRSLISRITQTVPGITTMRSECSYENLRLLMPKETSFVVQDTEGAGGYNTVLIQSKDDQIKINRLSSDILTCSAYIPNAVPINQHIVVLCDSIVLLPPSVQIATPSEEGAILYKGGDFSAMEMIPQAIRSAINFASENIGYLLRSNGYRGVAGIDYLVRDDDLFFIEINPRFQSSTKLLNTKLIEQNLPSVHELHLMAFQNKKIDLPNDICVTGSFLLGLNDGINKVQYESANKVFTSPDKRNTIFAQDKISIQIDTDGLTATRKIDPYAKLWTMTIDRQVARYAKHDGVTLDHAIWTYLHKEKPSLANISKHDIESLAHFKFNLFSHGLSLSEKVLESLSEERFNLTIRDGIAGGIELKLFDCIHINAPIKEYFSFLSPFQLDIKLDGGYVIRDEQDNMVSIEILPIPDFAGRHVSTGTPMLDIGQMFNERLSIEVFFGCVNTWANNTACHFCELGAERKPEFIELDDMTEMVMHCRDNPHINMRHILLGGGTPPDRLLHLYIDATRCVRKITDIPLYIMMAPPNDLSILNQLKELGVNEIGFNLEVFNREIARSIMPSKGQIPITKYFETMEYATKLWSEAGEVRSILIVGLEPLSSTLNGVRELCKRKVMPILSPFRPVPNTPLANHPTPKPELLFESWKQGQKIAAEYGMWLGPTCIACQNNTITMPHDEHYRYY